MQDFDRLRVLSLESRRSAEIEKLIRARGGDPFVAPSMREVPLSNNPQALQFAEQLFAGKVDMIIFLTGVGARILNQAIELQHPAGAFQEALRKVTVVVRGPKPTAVMRDWKVPVAASAKEPNTWRELLTAIEGFPERRIFVQEFGRTSQELIDALRARGAEVTSVPVYRWDLPEDTAALRQAALKLAAGEFDVVLFTTSVQVDHLFKIAEEEHVADKLIPALAKTVVVSIGPATSETLEERCIKVDLEPSHPRMGIMVAEAAQSAHEILGAKRVTASTNPIP